MLEEAERFWHLDRSRCKELGESWMQLSCCRVLVVLLLFGMWGQNGWTALHYAASKNSSAVAEVLLQAGAAVDAKIDAVAVVALMFRADCTVGAGWVDSSPLGCIQKLVRGGRAAFASWSSHK